MNVANHPAYRLLPALLLLGSVQAPAADAEATLREVVGTVLTNQGKVYQPAQSGTKLPLNARVLTKDGAGAVVISKQGCSTRLGPNSLFVVTQPDPCHGGPSAQKIGPAGYAPVQVTNAGNAAAGSANSVAGLSTNTLVGIGAGMAAGVAGGVMGGLAATGGLESPDGFSNNAAAQAASAAVIAAGGDAKAAYAAALAAANGGSPSAVSAAVIAAGGSPEQAYAAGKAAAGIVSGGSDCISPTSPDCAG